MSSNRSDQQLQAFKRIVTVGVSQKMQLRQLTIPLKSAQDFVGRLFKERDAEGETIQQSPRWMQATALSLMGTAGFAIGWLALATTDEVVTVSGKLEPLGSVQEIQMPLGGIAVVRVRARAPRALVHPSTKNGRKKKN